MEVYSRTNEIMIRPHWKQYVLCQAPVLLLCVFIGIGCLWASIPFIKNALLIVFFAAIAVLLYRVADMLRTVYFITDEQILYRHGVLVHTTDYMELYRVYDYQQHRSLLQQFSGLKTVTIMSSDRNISKLDMKGIREDIDVVGIVRQRVEYNKAYKHVYEIGNKH